jgi:hypothetical protein
VGNEVKRRVVGTIYLLLASSVGAAAADEAPHRYGPGDGNHHPGMSGATSAFHDLMRPLWHSPKGAARVAAGCKKAGEIHVRITALASERPESTAPATMTETVKALEAVCAAGKGDAVEAALDTLHQQFHQLMGMSGGRHRH